MTKEDLNELTEEEIESLAGEKGKRVNDFLDDPNIWETANNEFDKKIVGEQNARKTAMLVMCGSLVKNIMPTSSNLCINGRSGIGKDHVLSAVRKIWPTDKVIHRTRISDTAFTYWHNSKFEPDWNWDGKIFTLEDISEKTLNCDVFKVMSSGGSTSTITIHNQAFDIEIKGKPAMLITTANSYPNEELLRRYPIATLDESVDQTKAILVRQAELAESGVSPEYNKNLKEALGKLKEVEVVIPFAKKVAVTFPTEHVISRTYFSRVLDYIRCSAALHQNHRERNAQEQVIASPKDYGVAREVLMSGTFGGTLVPHTVNERKVLNVIRAVFPNEPFSIGMLSEKISSVTERGLYLILDRLQEDFLEISHQEVDNRQVRFYRIRPENHIIPLPSVGDIEVIEVVEVKKHVPIFTSSENTTMTTTPTLATTTSITTMLPINDENMLFSVITGKKFTLDDVFEIKDNNEHFSGKTDDYILNLVDVLKARGRIAELKPGEFTKV